MRINKICPECKEAFPGFRDTMIYMGRIVHISCYTTYPDELIHEWDDYEDTLGGRNGYLGI